MYGLAPSLIEQLHNIFAAQASIQRVILFGSRAKGNYRAGSDIDLAFELNSPEPLDSGKLAEELDQLDTPYLFDLVDLQQLKNPDLIQHIEDFGQLLYMKTGAKQ